MSDEAGAIGGHHDVGGAPAGRVPREQHALLPWEVRTDALYWIFCDPARPGGALLTPDELRRAIESLPAAEYRALGYFEKWLLGMVEILREKGIIDAAALKRRIAELTHAHAAEHAEHGHAGETQ